MFSRWFSLITPVVILLSSNLHVSLSFSGSWDHDACFSNSSVKATSLFGYGGASHPLLLVYHFVGKMILSIFLMIAFILFIKVFPDKQFNITLNAEFWLNFNVLYMSVDVLVLLYLRGAPHFNRNCTVFIHIFILSI